MTGTERLLEMVEDQEDMALKQTVDYLISRKDMEARYLNQEKNLNEMCDFIRSKANSHAKKRLELHNRSSCIRLGYNVFFIT